MMAYLATQSDDEGEEEEEEEEDDDDDDDDVAGYVDREAIYQNGTGTHVLNFNYKASARTEWLNKG
jgi:hypothetical protein